MGKIDLPVHNHPLFSSDKFFKNWCSGCRYYGFIYNGYKCNEPGCDTMFHKECAESPPEINYTSHPDHSLKLTLDVKGHCGLCGGYYWKVCYYCSICDFGLHLGCKTKPQGPLTLHHSTTHEHPLALSNLHSCQPPCSLCDLPYSQSKNLYKCSSCDMFFHMECVVPEIYHISHTKHPLKLVRDGPPNYSSGMCTLCGVKLQKILHHCDICNFSVCGDCSMNPPPLEVTNLKTHDHKLHQVPRELVFTCDLCGTLGKSSPYFCVQCNFMIHGTCIDLPRVININRHDHRISYTPYLGSTSLKCGVCRKKVSEFHGVYSCSKCPNYVVHLRCATRQDIWDKIELEGTNEDTEDTIPFQVIDDNTIKHFSHDHNLKLNKQDDMICKENVLCEACVMQIGSDPFYKCGECEYILHETCANLLRKKRHVCHNEPFTLLVSSKDFTSESEAECELCHHKFTGFRYQSGDHILDTRCGSITEPVISHHPHPLYFIKPLFKRCSTCKLFNHRGMLSCDDCEFTLNFKCAFLPKKIMIHRYDDHPLLLSTGVDIECWCEVCETKIDQMNWFYGCFDGCGVNLHVCCVIGDFTYHMPNRQITSKLGTYEVIFNISSSRPICFNCDCRCKLPFVLKFNKRGDDIYLCSIKCFIYSFKY